MIAMLTGIIEEKIAEVVVLGVGGVGYGLLVTGEDYGRLNIGQEAKLYVYEHIREQAHDLYGFIDLDTKKLFEQLLGVNGVGPKMALNVLSIGSSGEVRGAIAGGDTKFIQAAPGVGKRVAERIIVELKDKVDLIGVKPTTSGTSFLSAHPSQLQDEAAQALVSLGYSPVDALVALQDVPTDLPTEARIKQALKTTR